MHDEKILPARRVRRDGADTLLRFAEGLARVAASGGGASALAAHLAASLDAAVLVEDAQWRHLAAAGTAERALPPSVRELVPPDADGGEAVALAPPGDARARAFPVRAGDARLGWLTVFPHRGGEIDDGPVRLTAAQIAIELSREQSGGRGKRRGFWDRLLARAYEDPLEARDDALSRGISLAPGYVAVAVEGEGLDEAGAAQKSGEIRRVCLDTLGTRTGEVVTIERGAGCFFLVPAPLEVDAANARTAATLIPRAIARTGLEVRVVGGVGRHAEMIAVARSVDEAREAMTIARRMFGGGRVMPYEDLGVYPLLHRAGAMREDWRAFATRVLEPLRAYDDKHQTELVRTLALFFDVGQNIKEAAAQLNVHRHTVFYRLRQIGEIGKLDLDSPHDQLTVRAALAVDALEA
ncbi:MAG: helix-turn-helix domain-containing protein [Candidatus Eremiobacteraeota bacterium]|nr:helix-turn-helix domain-containing protein [Candidatus Eremiobacteraeota bacterium]